MGLLVNIDNGGTFTDACVSDGERVVHAKTPTTPHDLSRCFAEVLERAAQRLYGEASLERLLRETDHLRYSTTSSTNAIVEHKGAPVGLLVEAGEEEALYGASARIEANPELWSAMVPDPPVGISLGAEARVDADEVSRAVNGLVSRGVHRLVVAVRSPEVERAIKRVLLDRYPRHLLGAIPVLFSHELARDPDPGRRTMTAVVNSYLHPGLEHFLYSAEAIVRERHLRSPLLVFRNDGDSARVAKTTALKTYGSGPRGGIEGAVTYARHYGLPALVTMDVGGTTTDLSVVVQHLASTLRYGRAADLELSVPMAEIGSVGLGGSSVIRVEEGGLRIGPGSVGAAPGPACFGRGGGEATITDALLLAGLLDPLQYLGGAIRLDAARAEAAVERSIAKPLGLGVPEAVQRMWREYERAIAAHVRAALEGRGVAPEEAVLLVFGGAGPMSAAGIAEEAGIRRVLVPGLAAVFSAFGIGFSDIGHRYETPADEATAAGLEQAGGAMRRRAERDMYGEGVDPTACVYELALAGAREGREVVHPLGEGAVEQLGALRERERLEDEQVELRAIHRLPKPVIGPVDGGPRAAPRGAGRQEIDLGRGRESVEVFELAQLEPGASAAGPALVRDTFLTCFVRPGWRFAVSGSRDLLLEVS